jgi:hypothetical protein
VNTDFPLGPTVMSPLPLLSLSHARGAENDPGEVIYESAKRAD